MSTTQLQDHARVSPGRTAPRRVLIGLAGLALGGCQINALDLAAGLRAGGDHVVVFAVRDEEVPVSVMPYAASLGVEVIVLDRRGGLLALAADVRRLASASDAEVVHVFAPWLGMVAGVAAAGGQRFATVVTNWNMTNQFWGPAHAPLLVGTGDLADEARDHHRGQVHLMTPPVDVEKDVADPEAGRRFRAEHGVDDGALLLVLVSRVDRLMKLESIRSAVLAVELLADPTVTLVVVGDGDAVDEVRALAAQVNDRLGREAVLVPGALLDPHPAYAGADVVLGMGGAAIRGLAHSRPVVVLGEEGFALLYEPTSRPYFEREGFYGHGCDGDPATHLAQLVARLRDGDLRDRLGSIGRADVEDEYSLSAGIAQLRGIYDAAVSGRPRRTTIVLDGANILARVGLVRAAGAARAVLRAGRRARRREEPA